MTRWAVVLILAVVVTGGSAQAQSGVQNRIESDVRELLRKALVVYLAANFSP